MACSYFQCFLISHDASGANEWAPARGDAGALILYYSRRGRGWCRGRGFPTVADVNATGNSSFLHQLSHQAAWAMRRSCLITKPVFVQHEQMSVWPPPGPRAPARPWRRVGGSRPATAKDEARRIAANIAKLPELLGKSQT